MSQAIEAAKKLAAYTAVDNHVKPTDKVRELFGGNIYELRAEDPCSSLGSVQVSRTFIGSDR